MLWRSSCVALLPVLLLFCCGCVQAAPLFGLLSLLSGGAANGTGLLETLATAHLQHKLDKLEVLGDLIAIATNFTQTGISSFG